MTSGKPPLAERIETEKSHPLPWKRWPTAPLILVAYAVAGIVGMIPATPGGLGSWRRA